MILKSTVLLNNGDFKVFIFEVNSYVIMSVHTIMYTARHAVPPGKYDFKVFSHIITRENAIKNFRRKLCLAWSTVSLENY